uniref:Uncharacterized protein n=1 Tax=Knipowitschia caucasica TaxID=637954 RepID=A0AAV2KN98_KNICA
MSAPFLPLSSDRHCLTSHYSCLPLTVPFTSSLPSASVGKREPAGTVFSAAHPQFLSLCLRAFKCEGALGVTMGAAS